MSDRMNRRVLTNVLTVDGLTLRQVVIVLACEQRIAVAAHDALDVAVASVSGGANELRAIYIPVLNVVE